MFFSIARRPITPFRFHLLLTEVFSRLYENSTELGLYHYRMFENSCRRTTFVGVYIIPLARLYRL